MKNDTYLNKALDLLLDEAAAMANENIGIKLADEAAGDVEFSKEHEKRMKKIFASAKKAERKRGRRVIRYAAGIAAVLCLVIAFDVMNAGALRIKFMNFILETDQPNTDYSFGDSKAGSYSDDEIAIDYIPDGFEVDNSKMSEKIIYIKFKKDTQYFILKVEAVSAKMSIDTEEGNAEHLKVNGCEAVYTTNNNVNALIWHDGEYVYRISGNITKEEILKIAQSVRK